MSSSLLKDYSGKSMNILAEKVRKIFAEKLPQEKMWMTDIYEWPDQQSEDMNVVIFGDFFRKFLETGNWTHDNYKFWCLGKPAKNFLVNLAGFREEEVSVIPRHLLFQTREGQKPTKDMHLVYAGRLTPSKRILTQLWTVFYLQTKWNQNVKFSFFGDFILEEKFCSCPSENPYKEHVFKLLNDLDWKHQPEFGGLVLKHEWIGQNYRHPVFFSLSTLPFEDFSVSIAEAQEAGWPCIVTNWGAQKDLSGTTIKIPLHLLQSLGETHESAQKDGEVLADYIAKKEFQTSPYTQTEFTAPTSVSMAELDQRRRAFLAKWGMNFQDVIRHRTDDLRHSPKWAKFMEEYVKCFY